MKGFEPQFARFQGPIRRVREGGAEKVIGLVDWKGNFLKVEFRAKDWPLDKLRYLLGVELAIGVNELKKQQFVFHWRHQPIRVRTEVPLEDLPSEHWYYDQLPLVSDAVAERPEEPAKKTFRLSPKFKEVMRRSGELDEAKDALMAEKAELVAARIKEMGDEERFSWAFEKSERDEWWFHSDQDQGPRR